MATHVLLNPEIHWHSHRLGCVASNVQLTSGAEEKDATTFCNAGFRMRKAGLLTAALTLSGFADFDAPASQVPLQTLFTRMGTAHPILVASADDEGATAWLHEGLLTSKEFWGSVGDMDPNSVSLMGDGPLVQGTVLHPGDTNRTATSTSTGVQQGSVSATQKAYAALHVTHFTAGTLDVIVQSDDNSGFTTPTTRFTFTQAAGVTSQWASPLAGAVADDWWRVSWTIAGGGTWKFAVGFGIR